MNLPIQFPKDEDVIADEVARFRALTPENRMRSIRGLIATGAWMARQSPKADFIREFTLEQEDLTKRTLREFWTRHVR